MVSVPQELLIHGGTAAASDLGRAMAATGADADTLKLLWSCVERHDPESQHAAFWESLPAAIDTGAASAQCFSLLLRPQLLACVASAGGASTSTCTACRAHASPRSARVAGRHCSSRRHFGGSAGAPRPAPHRSPSQCAEGSTTISPDLTEEALC